MVKKKVTIKDVAHHSGVSIATVSQILNGNEDKFSSKTVEKVLAAKNELGYQADYFARQMITKETKTIGVLVPDITNPFFNLLMRGIEEILYQQHFVTILCNADSNQQKEVQYLSELTRRGVDGFIIASSAISTQAIKEDLQQQGRPFIVLDQKKAEDFSDSVRTDDFRGGYLAGTHLFSLGHQQVALVYPENPPANVQERIEGFKSAADAYQIDYNQLLLIPTAFSKQGGYQITNQIVASEATAIFALNDELAFGLYRGLEELGKIIPDDYSIIGYDNVDMSEYVKPKLTTIAQPIFELGQEAAKLLLERIQHPEKNQEEKLLPVHLEKRFSTAPLK